MIMKQHILQALREMLDQWEGLLASLDESQIAAPLLPSPWTVKDEMAHLMAWQQRTIARTEAARLGREPEFPRWSEQINSDGEDNTDQVNALIYQLYHDQPWSEIYQAWRSGFLRLLESAQATSERDLLDGDRYPWLQGYPLAAVLLSTYDHHQEHFEKLVAWLEEHGMRSKQ